MKADSTFALKDHLFNRESVNRLATLLTAAYPAFPRARFCTTVLAAFPELELKERITHITTTLHSCLPTQYRQALSILLRALPPELDPAQTDDDFGDFILAPLSEYVATYGCAARQLTMSLRALREITKRFSAEFATRVFLNRFPGETLAFLDDCARDNHYHVRRLASESTRPLLPWAPRIGIDYRAPLPLLDHLHTDSTRYVTRSVANHLNDISKRDPDLVVTTLRRWQRERQQAPAELAFITTHALRTLIRNGDARALALLGFGTAPDIRVRTFAISTPRVRIGEAARFTLALTARRRAKLLIDYVMTFAGNSQPPARKVFRWTQQTLEAGESVTLEKVHPMRLMTTRRLHAGEHRITLQVNGRAMESLTFQLLAGRGRRG